MRRPILITTALFFALAAPAHAAWTWPVAGEVITPYRNGADPYAAGQHRGIDIAAPAGAPVVAAAGGEVRFAGTAGSSGLTVSVRTGDGYDTSYLHLASIGVREGASVSAGDRLGAVGTTGTRSAAEPHLHFGVRDAGSRHAYHDPLGFLPPLNTPPGAPDAPPATAAEPSPAPPSVAPVPVARTAPVARRAPVANAQPGRAPAALGAPRPLPAPRRMGAVGRTPHVAPATGPEPSRGTGNATMGARAVEAGRPAATHGARLRSQPPAPGPAAGRVPGSARVPSPELRRARTEEARARPAAPSRSSPAGPDIGWALACAGLLLAAGILGLTEGGRGATASGRPGVLRAIRPLLGGR